MSSSFWWDNKDYQTNLITASTPSEPLPTFYMDSGTALSGEDWCAIYTGEILDYMTSVGFTENLNVAKYVDVGGAHSETYWGPRFHIPLNFLYPADGIPKPPRENQLNFL